MAAHQNDTPWRHADKTTRSPEAIRKGEQVGE